jgi:hypothetical protein
MSSAAGGAAPSVGRACAWLGLLPPCWRRAVVLAVWGSAFVGAGWDSRQWQQAVAGDSVGILSCAGLAAEGLLPFACQVTSAIKHAALAYVSV